MSEYASMAAVVQPGQFSLFTGTTGLPSPLDTYVHPTTGGFYGILAAASLTSQSPPTLGGIRPHASAPVYSINAIRSDPGHPGSPEPHSNVDRRLLFLDERGRPF